MDVRSMRNAVLGARVVNALKSRNMDAYYVETKEEAVASIFCRFLSGQHQCSK